MLFKEILVPVDFSEASLRAVRLAVRVAKASEGRITLLHVGVSPAMTWADMTHYGVVVPQSLVDLHAQVAREQEHQLKKIAREEIPDG